MAAYRFLPFAALLLAASAAHGAAEPAHVGAWTIQPDSEFSCQAVANFGDNLVVRISEDSTGTGSFLISDDRWSLENYGRSPASLSWDGWKNAQNVEFTPAQLNNGRWVLIMETGSWFTESLVDAGHIWLRIPGAGFEEDLAVDDALKLAYAIVNCNSKH